MDLIEDAIAAPPAQEALEAMDRAWRGRSLEVFDVTDGGERHFRSTLMNTRLSFSREYGQDTIKLVWVDQPTLEVAVAAATSASFGPNEADPHRGDILVINEPSRRLTITPAQRRGDVPIVPPEAPPEDPHRERAVREIASALPYLTGRTIRLRDERAKPWPLDVHGQLIGATRDETGWTIKVSDHAVRVDYEELTGAQPGAERLTIGTCRGVIKLDARRPTDDDEDVERW